MTQSLNFVASITKDTEFLKFQGFGCNGAAEAIKLYNQLPEWKHILAEISINQLSGAGITLNAVTSVNTSAKLDINSAKANGSDGVTEFKSAKLTEPGSYIIAITRDDNIGATSNIGALIGFYLEKDNVNKLDGQVNVLITG